MNLKDLSILIALKIDSVDRLTNLDITMQYLKAHFDTTVIISEQNEKPVLKDRYDCEYVFTESNDFFNRQKTLNAAANHSSTPFIAHYDADVLFHPVQMESALNGLRGDKCDVIYPYDGKFYDVPKMFHEQIKNTNSIEYVNLNMCKLFNSHSVGGAVMFKRDVFFEGGMANEKFLGLGYEDNEINHRFTRLGYKIARNKGPLFHLTHSRGETSFDHNPHAQTNIREFKRVAAMNVDQLKQEISTWDWVE
jgi:hypothetical protein